MQKGLNILKTAQKLQDVVSPRLEAPRNPPPNPGAPTAVGGDYGGNKSNHLVKEYHYDVAKQMAETTWEDLNSFKDATLRLNDLVESNAELNQLATEELNPQNQENQPVLNHQQSQISSSTQQVATSKPQEHYVVGEASCSVSTPEVKIGESAVPEIRILQAMPNYSPSSLKSESTGQYSGMIIGLAVLSYIVLQIRKWFRNKN